jgi:hypothetical protein
MGVRIDKSGHHYAAISIQHFFVSVDSAHFITWPNGCDGFVLDQNGSIFDDAKFAQMATTLRRARDYQKLGN